MGQLARILDTLVKLLEKYTLRYFKEFVPFKFVAELDIEVFQALWQRSNNIQRFVVCKQTESFQGSRTSTI